MDERYLSTEDIRLVKKILKSDMIFGLVVTIAMLLFTGLAVYSNIATKPDNYIVTVVIICLCMILVIFAGRFLLKESLSNLRQLQDGDYDLCIYEVKKCWSERVTTDNDTRYYLSAVPLSPDSNFTSMSRERVDTETYSRVKGYKYAYMISFRNNGGKRVEFGSAIVLDSTKTRSYIFYKSTNELLG